MAEGAALAVAVVVLIRITAATRSGSAARRRKVRPTMELLGVTLATKANVYLIHHVLLPTIYVKIVKLSWLGFTEILQ